MKNSGFTLLETIIYCALFSVLMTSALVTVYALMNSNEKTQKQIHTISEVSFLNQKLQWIFTNATSIEFINPQTLKIIRPDLPSHSPFILEFKNNNVYLSRGILQSNVLLDPYSSFSLQSLIYVESKVTIVYSLNGLTFRFVMFSP